MATDDQPIPTERYPSGDVVAFAVVTPEEVIDWSRSGVPQHTLWLPEGLVEQLIAASPPRSPLHKLNIYTQTRLDEAASRRLLSELETLSSRGDEDIDFAVDWIRKLIFDQLATPGTCLLIEGP